MKITNLKLTNLNKREKTILICGAALFAIVVILCSTANWRARHALKAECGAGMDCICFSNVVDNRLSMNQVRAFRTFLKSVKHRPTTNILEFTDEVSAQGISQAVTMCRLVPVQPEKPEKPAKKK